MISVYIDQNILVYLSEGKISLPKTAEYTWVYSDEHFAEIERSGSNEILSCLNELGARRIRMLLDEKFKITNEVYLDEFRSAFEIYDEYISAKKEYANENIDFVRLLSFFSGNKDAIQLEMVAGNFVSGIEDLMSDILKDLDCEEQKKVFHEKISLIGQSFQSTLVDASKKSMSIEELRKALAGADLSNLNDTKGLIVDQIWKKLCRKYPEISRDQFFGKKPICQKGFEGEFPLFLSIVQCYTALNFVGFWPDKKMSQISKIYGINSDASHVGHAAFCSAFVSEDKRMCKKASAIYNYFNIPTQIIQIQVSQTGV